MDWELNVVRDGGLVGTVNGGVRDNERRTSADAELNVDSDKEFSLAWARSSPVHELSAHGRNVQQRLDTPPAGPVRPSLRKRLRFALYRIFNGK